jgi:hypothetical protein
MEMQKRQKSIPERPVAEMPLYTTWATLLHAFTELPIRFLRLFNVFTKAKLGSQQTAGAGATLE